MSIFKWLNNWIDGQQRFEHSKDTNFQTKIMILELGKYKNVRISN